MEEFPLPLDVDYSFVPREDRALQRDQLVGLMVSEAPYKVNHIYCQATSLVDPSCQSPLEDWRRKICQWAFRVIDHFQLDRDVVSIGMNIFDRFVASGPTLREFDGEVQSGCPCSSCQSNIDSQTYQLAAMTSIYLAVKVHGDDSDGFGTSRRKLFRLTTFVELSRGQFSANDICDMERTILQAIRWKVNPPTPMDFVSFFLALMPDRNLVPVASQGCYSLVLHVLRELSRYMTELAVCLGESCSYHLPSEVALASIFVSMDILTYQALPGTIRADFVSEALHVIGCATIPEQVRPLRATLQRSLWPELLLDDSGGGGDHAQPYESSGHPICLARDFGLLDLGQVYRLHHSAVASHGCDPESSPSPPKATHCRQGSASWSPISVDH